MLFRSGEGAGKSTIAAFLKQTLGAKEWLITRAAGSPFGEEIRELLVSDDAKELAIESRFFLWWSAHIDHIFKVVEPALAGGVSVISDRFDASIFAYQVHAENASHLKEIFRETREKICTHVHPNLYIFLDIPPKEGFKRFERTQKKLDYFEKRPLDFHERVREGYKEFFKNVPHAVVDANHPLEEVQEEVLAIIQKQL